MGGPWENGCILWVQCLIYVVRQSLQCCGMYNICNNVISYCIGLCFNSLWPSDTMWQYKSRSTLVQVMACSLMAPSHYLNQCWHTTCGVLWHSPNTSFTGSAQDINSENDRVWKYIFKISFTALWIQWVNMTWLYYRECHLGFFS